MTQALASQFARLAPLIAEAVALGAETTTEAALAEVLSGRAQLWPGEGSFLITQCVQADDGTRAIHAWLGGGILSELAELRPGVEAFGRAMGAQFATIDGRPGWRRFYEKAGYRLDDDGVLRKAL